MKDITIEIIRKHIRGEEDIDLKDLCYNKIYGIVEVDSCYEFSDVWISHKLTIEKERIILSTYNGFNSKPLDIILDKKLTKYIIYEYET